MLGSAMLGKSVLLHTRDKAGARRLSTCLRASGNDVVRTVSPLAAADLIRARSVDMVLLDYDSSPSCSMILDAAGDDIPVVVTSSRRNPSEVLDLLCRRGVDHVLVRAKGTADDASDATLASLDAREVVITAEKILRRELFGIDKYLAGFGVDINSCEVRDADDRCSVVALVQEYVGALGAGRGVDAAAALVADELVSNAIYNGPRDPEGNPLHSRTSPVLLESGSVRVRFGSDGERFVLSVTDSFGTLGPSALRQSLQRCLTSSTPFDADHHEGGLGLYMVLASCNQLVLNVEPGVRTEVIAVVDIRDRMRGVRLNGRSLHLFMQRNQAVAPRTSAAPIDKIVVSDTMRWELNTSLAEVSPAPSMHLGSPISTIEPDAAAGTPEVARGLLIGPVPESPGIDTTCGLIRGAARADVALHAAMRFLTSFYAGAVAYVVEGAQLVPWFAMGGVSDWERVQRLEIRIDAPCSLARMARDAVVGELRPTPCPLDYRLARCTAGGTSSRALVFPIRVDGIPRFVVYSFIPRFDRLLPPAALEMLRTELERLLGRIAAPMHRRPRALRNAAPRPELISSAG